MTNVPNPRRFPKDDEASEQSEALRLAHECGAVSYTPGPLRAVRGVSMTFEQLDAFEARVLAQAAAPAVALTQTGDFPLRILSLLKDVADRNPPEPFGPFEDDRGEPLQDDADAALAWIAGRSAQTGGWVSVDERLPTKNTEVLIAFRDSPLPATGQYTAHPRDEGGWCFPAENDTDEIGPVIAWQPLPAHPTLPPSPAAEREVGA